MKTDSFREKLVTLCKSLQISLAHRKEFDIEWDGITLSTNTTNDVLAHNIAHWLICPQDRRHFLEFGLGNYPDSHINIEPYVSLQIAEHEEELASILGIAIQAYYGDNFVSTLMYHGWFDEQNQEKFWELIFELNNKGYLLNHIPVCVLDKKQTSRDKDEQDLLSGRKTREQLRKENGYFSQFKFVVNYSKAKQLY